MKAREKRLVLVAVGIMGVGVAAWLAVGALRSNISYYFSPTQVMANEAPAHAVYRLGGLVVKNSLARQPDPCAPSPPRIRVAARVVRLSADPPASSQDTAPRSPPPNAG